jgi:hypothetical protein
MNFNFVTESEYAYFSSYSSPDMRHNILLSPEERLMLHVFRTYGQTFRVFELPSSESDY